MLRRSFCRFSRDRFKELWDKSQTDRIKHQEISNVIDSIKSTKRVLGYLTPLIHVMAKSVRYFKGRSTDLPEISMFETWHDAKTFENGCNHAYKEVIERLYNRKFQQIYNLVDSNIEKQHFNEHVKPVWVRGPLDSSTLSSSNDINPIEYNDSEINSTVTESKSESDPDVADNINLKESVVKSTNSMSIKSSEVSVKSDSTNETTVSSEKVIENTNHNDIKKSESISSNSTDLSSTTTDSEKTEISTGTTSTIKCSESSSKPISDSQDSSGTVSTDSEDISFKTEICFLGISGPTNIDMLQKANEENFNSSAFRESMKEQAQGMAMNIMKEEPLHIDIEGHSYNEEHNIMRIDKLRLTTAFNITGGIVRDFRVTQFENVYNNQPEQIESEEAEVTASEDSVITDSSVSESSDSKTTMAEGIPTDKITGNTSNTCGTGPASDSNVGSGLDNTAGSGSNVDSSSVSEPVNSSAATNAVSSTSTTTSKNTGGKSASANL